ncbi:hypothetical protein DCCM_2920 [Desulfocucumis palustris]|uniref:Uncharacterized protein n=1 Tax=Desulfocucumis palustris TaxID=1898651 RepID=A0A2L2XBW2_9FIRM|nr:hypothetical protein [Desulfocucumis palustris]GBF33809.1 hypothetical protein DCCM_2920 [Desulfocucumis palustris]
MQTINSFLRSKEKFHVRIIKKYGDTMELKLIPNTLVNLNGCALLVDDKVVDIKNSSVEITSNQLKITRDTTSITIS